MKGNLQRIDIAPSFFAENQFVDTNSDDIRCSRAFRVIHALEILKRRGSNVVLSQLAQTTSKVKLDDTVVSALGAEMMDVFCRGYSRKKSHDGKLLEGVKAVVDEVLLAEGKSAFSVQSSRFQEVFRNAVIKRPKNAETVMKALKTFKDLAPEDFQKLRTDMNFNVGALSVVGKGALAHVRLLDKGNMRVILAAEEMLHIGFDMDTLESRLDI